MQEDPVKDTFGKVHVATHIPNEKVDNYVSVRKLMDLTNISYNEITKFNYDFRSHPERCLCGHKLNIYDLFYESWKQGAHDKDFIVKYLNLLPKYYFQKEWNITCPSCDTEGSYLTLYRYGDSSKYA